MKGYLIVGVLTVAGVARAQDSLEMAATAQAKAQASDAKQEGQFLKGMGEKTDFQILLDVSKCYWFSGTSEGLSKFYMYLWAPGANLFTPRVADAKAAAAQVTMAYCPKQSGMHKFQVKTEGKSRYVVGIFAKDAPPQAAAPPPPPPSAAAPAPAPTNLGAICDKTAASSSNGAKRVGEYFSGSGGSIGHDDRSDYTVQMEGGKCYWVVGCGEPGKVKSLYLYLWGPDNRRITEAKSDSPNPMVGHCPQMTGMFKVQAKMHGGKGAYNVGVYAK